MVGFFARNWSFNPLEGVKDAELQGVVALTVALQGYFQSPLSWRVGRRRPNASEWY